MTQQFAIDVFFLYFLILWPNFIFDRGQNNGIFFLAVILIADWMTQSLCPSHLSSGVHPHPGQRVECVQTLHRVQGTTQPPEEPVSTGGNLQLPTEESHREQGEPTVTPTNRIVSFVSLPQPFVSSSGKLRIVNVHQLIIMIANRPVCYLCLTCQDFWSCIGPCALCNITVADFHPQLIASF